MAAPLVVQGAGGANSRHLTLDVQEAQILLGMEGDGVHIAHNPLENQDYGVKAFELLEKKTKIPSDKPYVLPHTHLPLKVGLV